MFGSPLKSYIPEYAPIPESESPELEWGKVKEIKVDSHNKYECLDMMCKCFTDYKRKDHVDQFSSFSVHSLFSSYTIHKNTIDEIFEKLNMYDEGDASEG